MKRYTITPQPRKSVKLNQMSLKPVQFPRMSLMADETVQKETRNIRDKVYKTGCIEKISKFLTENGYEGAYSQKTLGNPSNKEFQSIFKFIYSFIDSTPFLKFEDDVLSILKLLKYPYCSEINRSQLATVTPHTWPVVLSMISWVVDIIEKSDQNETQAATIESEFFEYVCDGYSKFMEGEDDEELEKQFMNRIDAMHINEKTVIENQKKEVELTLEELENIKSKFDDLSKLENRKKKVTDDINALIINDKQLEVKKNKYVASIEKVVDEITAIETQIDFLIKVKNDLTVQINSQTINPQDIKEMNIEKVELFKELEKLKPERETLTKALKSIESNVLEKTEENEKLLIEINSLRKGFNITKDSFKYTLIVDLENELVTKKESCVNYEIALSSFEDKLKDKEAQFKDLEEQYSHMNTKLQTVGSIYLEKKEISERAQQKNRNEIDRLENELLKLKLESDSIYLKSEKDYSEAKIKLDVLNSLISKEREEISRMVWDFYNSIESVTKSIDQLEKEFRKPQK
ncbi:kinetochore-associated Ndc80 complex subunit ndc80 [Glugoides intestinalis]